MVGEPQVTRIKDLSAPFGYHPGTTIPRRHKVPESHSGKGKCKHCGAEDLVWERINDHWYLKEMGGKRHRCPRPIAST